MLIVTVRVVRINVILFQTVSVSILYFVENAIEMSAFGRFLRLKYRPGAACAKSFRISVITIATLRKYRMIRTGRTLIGYLTFAVYLKWSIVRPALPAI